MKKLILCALMCLWSALSNGQTYYYKYLHWVEKETGVKHSITNPEKNNTYITFVNNKSICYFSDSQGNLSEKESGSGIGFHPPIWSGGVKYSYQGYKNGRHVYMSIQTTSECSPFWSPYANVNEDGLYHKVYDTKKYLYFNDDYTRLNTWTDPIYYVYECKTSNVVKAAIDRYTSYNAREHSTSIGVYVKTQSPLTTVLDPDVLY